MAAPARPVVRLSPDQQRVATLGAYAAAVIFVALRAPTWADYPAGIAASAIGVAMAAFLYYAARRGTLVLTVVAAFVVSLGPWGVPLLGAPYMAWAGVVLYRASKAASVAAGPQEPRRKKGKKEKAPPEDEPVERRPPEQSKRYTPPVQKKRR